MDKTELRALIDGDLCSIARTVELIGDRWSMLILREAFYGTSRFADLLENLHISRAVLTDRLDSLVAHGLLERVRYQPPGERARYEYLLTDAGQELIPAFVSLLQWGDKHRNGGRPPITLVHARCGAHVRAELRCARGHTVTPDALEPEPGPGLAPAARARARRA